MGEKRQTGKLDIGDTHATTPIDEYSFPREHGSVSGCGIVPEEHAV